MNMHKMHRFILCSILKLSEAAQDNIFTSGCQFMSKAYASVWGLSGGSEKDKKVPWGGTPSFALCVLGLKLQ